MAALTNRTTQTIYWLCNKGNAIRKMKSVKLLDRILIPLEELTDFPFTSSGKNSAENAYHYDANGKVIEDE